MNAKNFHHFHGLGDYGLDGEFEDSDLGPDGICGVDAQAALDAIREHYTPPAEMQRDGGEKPVFGKTGQKLGGKTGKNPAAKKRPATPDYRRCFTGTSNPPAGAGPFNAERFANLALRVFHQLTRFTTPNFDAAAELVADAEREFCREAEELADEERRQRLQAMNGDRHNPWI